MIFRVNFRSQTLEHSSQPPLLDPPREFRTPSPPRHQVEKMSHKLQRTVGDRLSCPEAKYESVRRWMSQEVLQNIEDLNLSLRGMLSSHKRWISRLLHEESLGHDRFSRAHDKAVITFSQKMPSAYETVGTLRTFFVLFRSIRYTWISLEVWLHSFTSDPIYNK